MNRKARGIQKDGRLYDCMFELPPGIDETVKTGAKLDDTIAMLPLKVREYSFQANRIAAALQDMDGNVRRTCENIWKFLYRHIAYKPDQKGKEQVRSVWRLWSDKLGDCDCFSFFTSCVLSVLKIPHTFRVTEYSPPDYEKGTGGYQHIYVVVPDKGKEITIDAVLPEFDNEYPYLNKIDQKMDLQFLNGIDPEMLARNGGMSVDAEDLLSCQLPSNDESVGALKNFFQKAKDKVQNVTQHIKQDVKNVTQNIKQDVKKATTGVRQAVKKAGTVVSKGVHVINRINPATAALRLGILASMKLNLFGVAGQLRYAYLTDADAEKRGVNMKRFDRYKKVRTKLEKIFFNAGGKPENLKESILTGKGNQDKGVALSGFSLSGLGFSNSSSVRDIIGGEMFADEIPQDGLNGLGEPITAATVTAASGLLATIAGILKNIGNLFQKGEPGPDKDMDALDKQAGENTSPTEESGADSNSDGGADNGSDDYSNERSDESTTSDDSSSDSSSTDSGDNNTQSGGDGSTPDTGASTFFDKAKDWVVKNKTPLIVTGISAAAAIAGFVIFRKFKGKKKKKGERAETTQGVPRGTSSPHKHKSKYGGSKNDKILRDLRLSRLK